MYGPASGRADNDLVTYSDVTTPDTGKRAVIVPTPTYVDPFFSQLSTTVQRWLGCAHDRGYSCTAPGSTVTAYRVTGAQATPKRLVATANPPSHYPPHPHTPPPPPPYPQLRRGSRSSATARWQTCHLHRCRPLPSSSPESKDPLKTIEEQRCIVSSIGHRSSTGRCRRPESCRRRTATARGRTTTEEYDGCRRHHILGAPEAPHRCSTQSRSQPASTHTKTKRADRPAQLDPEHQQHPDFHTTAWSCWCGCGCWCRPTTLFLCISEQLKRQRTGVRGCGAWWRRTSCTPDVCSRGRSA
jgi:hypothetical protein